MVLPEGPITLTPEQIAELSRKLANFRHDVNNHLSLIVAATELIKFNPDMVQRMAVTLSEQPPKISDQINRFSLELEKAIGISR